MDFIYEVQDAKLYLYIVTHKNKMNKFYVVKDV